MQNNDEYIQARLNICISSDNSRAASAIIAADPGNTQPLDFDGYKKYQEYGYAYDLAFKYFVYVLDHIDENGDIVWEMEIFDSNGIVYNKETIKNYRNMFKLNDFIRKARGKSSILI